MKSPLIGVSTCLDIGLRINPERTYQYLEISYAEAVAEGGGIPLLLPYLKSSAYEGILSRISGLIITGGEDLPSNVPGEVAEVPLVMAPESRIEQDKFFLRWALEHKIPILGICYGMQFINLHFGGTLFYDIAHQLPGTLVHRPGNMGYQHRIKIKEGSRLFSMVGEQELIVNSGHHQGVRDVGRNLSAVATCTDGVIEAIEAPGDNFIAGLQWHPEKSADRYRKKIFSAFVEACKNSVSSKA